MQGKNEQAASNCEVLLRHHGVHALREVHMGNERRTDGEEADNSRSNAGLKANENCEAAYKFNQTDDNSRNGNGGSGRPRPAK